jgi:hypothetical protein
MIRRRKLELRHVLEDLANREHARLIELKQTNGGHMGPSLIAALRYSRRPRLATFAI